MDSVSKGHDQLSPLKRAFLKLEEMQAKLDAIERSQREPMAIIGIGCRFPGGADNPEAFWRLLRDGVDTVTEIPPDRWDADAYYDPKPDVLGKMSTKWGAFLAQVDEFDPQFFAIAPREAVSMDPQQRLLLEVSWEALENAGQAPDKLSGSRTGVFVGMCKSDYLQLQVKLDDPARYDAYYASGNAHSMASGRLSYILGLQGPSITVDTACSSALVALHLACQSLRLRECRMALVGGVNLILSPESTIAFCRSSMMAAAGRCKTFDADADGFVQGEGCGVVILKRLSDALADGDHILALIRGTAVNQDGPSSGLTAPNGPAQEVVIHEALTSGGVQSWQVGYIEAHGTGTSLGDPIEVQALAAVLGQGRSRAQPLLIGSVKTNIGHLEAAAGIAGLIKVVLALQHKEIPPHLHFHNPNPYIPWEELPVKVATKLTPWAPVYGTCIAGVSAFGFSGTNAHVVLEEAPAAKPAQVQVERPLHLLSLSAKSQEALKELSQRFERHLAAHPSESPADLCFTANVGRAHFAHRLAIVAASAAQMHQRLAAFVTGQASAGVRSGQGQDPDPLKIAFLFTGQGAQYVGMGRQLYDTQPTFRNALDRCDELLRPYLEQPLLSVLYPNPGMSSALDETAYTQPGLFALQYALAELWASWGITPAVVMGHSVGEYAAACVAGVFSVEDGIKLVAQRGGLMQTLCPRGSMAAVFADEERIAAATAPYATTVTIAAINGPEHVVISGERQALREVLEKLEAEGIKTRPLTMSQAFHSPLMEPMLDAFEQAAAGVKYSPPRIGLISNLTGLLAKGGEIAHTSYWRRHVREPVRFSSAMASLYEKGYQLFVEIGPSPTLLGMGKRCVPAEGVTWLPSLRKGRDDWQQMLESLAALYIRGAQVDWAGLDRDYPRRRVALPTYPFQRKRYWIEAHIHTPRETAALPRNRPMSEACHPVLGPCLRSPLVKEIVFESRFDTGSPPFLNDHRVYGMAVLPAAAYLEMALAAAAGAFGVGPRVLQDVDIREALILPEGEVRTVQLIVTPEDAENASFQLISLSRGEAHGPTLWKLHATGKVHSNQSGYHAGTPTQEQVSLSQLQTRCQREVSVGPYYQRLRELGIQLGPSFRCVQKLWCGAGEALGQIQLMPDLVPEAGAYQIHPVLLDGCLQPFAAASLSEEGLAKQDSIYMPIGLKSFRLLGRAGIRLWSHVVVRQGDRENREILVGDVDIFDEAGRIVAEVEGLCLKRVDRKTLLQAAQERLSDWLYEVEWQPKPLQSQESVVRSPDYLPAPAQIAERLQPMVSQLSARHGLDLYDKLLPKLDILCGAYVLNAFTQLGWEPRLHQRVSVNTLAAQLGVVDQHCRLLSRLLEILQEDGVLQREGLAWAVCQVPHGDEPQKRWTALAEQFPAGIAELTLTRRGGQHLAEALRGECNPLQLLFPDGSFELADKLYRESPAALVFNTLAQEAISIALEQAPAARMIRVLEIGAGTGGTTSFVLPRLPAERTNYVFTDVSPLFTSKAAQRFRDAPFVRYQLLDIERDPKEQGFAAHQFDLILAANVLHATADLRQTLRHVQQLLAPEGLLMLLEGTRRQRWIDLTFGLTEGWWKFTDLDLRPSSPLLTQRRWLDVLEEMGFHGAVTIPTGDVGGALAEHAVILARGPQIERGLSASPVPEEPGSWLIFADRGRTGEKIAELFKSRGQCCVLVSPGEVYEAVTTDHFTIDPMRPTDFHRLRREALGDHRPPCRGVIHLWTLDELPAEELTAAQLAQAHIRGCRSVLHLTQALVTAGGLESPTLWLVTRGAQPANPKPAPLVVSQAPMWGLGKVIALEHPELHCRRMDLDPSGGIDEAQVLFEEIWSRGPEDQVAYRHNVRYVARLVRSASKNQAEGKRQGGASQPVRLEISTPGTLNGLVVRPMTRRDPGPGEVEIRVHATGLNFRDVLNTLGMRRDTDPLGGECAGTIVTIGEGVEDYQVGDEVIAIATGSFSTFATAHSQLVVPKPEHFSFEAAATLALAFLTACYALHQVGKMSRGERVLIHAAAGGVGMAAVQLAQRAGAEIFATAGNSQKREFLKSLGVPHVMDSRSLAFAEEVMARTGGEGVDIVLNSLTGGFIPKGLSVLRANGRFLEIGKSEIWDESQVAGVNSTASYVAIDLAEKLQTDPHSIRPILLELMASFERGALKPLPMRVFAFHEAVSAFRYMAQAEHIGKIVVTQREPSDDQVSRSEGRRKAPLTIRSDQTYLVTGGLGGLGLLVAQWLVEQGARHLVLLGRSAASSAASETISKLERAGAHVMVLQGDVSREEQLRETLAEIAQSLPPLRGVVHAAGVLDDGVLLQQDWDRFATVMAPKVEGAWNLHALTKNVPLDFFVLFSSAASLLGSPGQGNHAAANAFLDALAHHRRALDLPALSLNWGAWSDIGAAARRKIDERITVQGMDTFSPPQGLQVFEQLLQETSIQVGVMPVSWSTFLHQFGAGGEPPFFAELAREARILYSEQPASERLDLLHHIEQAPSSKRPQLLLAYVRDQVIKVLGLDAAQSIDHKQPLQELGLDSLMAVELRNLLGTGLGLKRTLPAALIYDYPTISALTDYLAREALCWETPSGAGAEPRQGDGNVTNTLERIEQLSEDEVDRLLAAKMLRGH